jgi:hypothetical protein
MPTCNQWWADRIPYHVVLLSQMPFTVVTPAAANIAHQDEL